MEVKSINFLNLDTLYDIVLEKYYDINLRNEHYGRNLQQLLSHIEIILNLGEVSQYEYIFLKMYCNNITKLENREFNLENIEKNYEKINNNIIRLLTFLSSIGENDKTVDYDSYLSPSGIITGNCSVSLTGTNLVNIFTIDPLSFFITASENDCIIQSENPNDNKPDPEYKNKIYTDERIKNYIISEFLHGFYKFMNSRITYVDLVCDTFNIKNFLTLSNVNDMRVINLRNPYVICDFTEDNTNDILEHLKIYKTLNETSDFTIKNTEFEICVNSYFGVFFEFMNILPYNKFITFDSFNDTSNQSLIGMNIPECPDELKELFNLRYNTRLKDLNLDINKNYSSDGLKRALLTENYITFKFIIKLSLEDIDRYLNEYYTENKDSKDYLVKSTNVIIKKIIKFTMSIFSSMR